MHSVHSSETLTKLLIYSVVRYSNGHFVEQILHKQ